MPFKIGNLLEQRQTQLQILQSKSSRKGVNNNHNTNDVNVILYYGRLKELIEGNLKCAKNEKKRTAIKSHIIL